MNENDKPIENVDASNQQNNKEEQPSNSLQSTSIDTEKYSNLISPEMLFELKANENWSEIEKYCRSGSIELIPRQILVELLEIKNDLFYVMQFLSALAESVKGVTEKSDVIQSYIKITQNEEGQNVPKFQMTKVLGELIPWGSAAMFNKGKIKKENLPQIFKVFTESFNGEPLDKIDLNQSLPVLNRNGLDLLPFFELLQKIGFVKNSENNASEPKQLQ